MEGPDEEAVSALAEAATLVRKARLKISDAGLSCECHARELSQIQSHLQLDVIHLDELTDDLRRGLAAEEET